jgi:hypothetical protein
VRSSPLTKQALTWPPTPFENLPTIYRISQAAEFEPRAVGLPGSIRSKATPVGLWLAAARALTCVSKGYPR